MESISLPNIKSYYQSLKFVYPLIRYNAEAYPSIGISTKFYSGLNDKNPPVKIMTPPKHRDRVAILFPGASPTAEDHPKMIMLGQVLAQNGFKVYIPRIPPLKKLDITIINVQWFTCFYQWIINTEKVNPQKILMAGMSYGGGLMLRMLKEINNKVPLPKSVLTFGTYSDSHSLLHYFLTGNISVKGKQFNIPPNEWGLVVIFQNYLKILEINWDSIELQRAIQLRIQNENLECNIQVDRLPDFQKGLFYSIISGKATPEVKKLAQAIFKIERESLKKISPKYWAKDIPEKVFIMHGAHDSMVPFTESIQLAEYLPNTELCISYLYEHNEFSSNGGFFFKIKELIKLLQFYAKLFFHYEN